MSKISQSITDLITSAQENDTERLDLNANHIISEKYLKTDKLKKIPDEIFKITTLKHLDISNHELHELPTEKLQQLGLETLNIAFNPLEVIPDVPGLIIDGKQYLHHFRKLSRENITELVCSELTPEELTNLLQSLCKKGHTHLRSLRISHTPLNTIPEAVLELVQLTTLKLISCQLTALPESISALSQLTTLELYENQLNTLPESVSTLSQLTTLNLDENQLNTLPECIGNLSQLTRLDLDNNELNTLPKWFGNLRQLNNLYINHNQLTQLPENIGNLNQLTSLMLDGNQLTQLPDSIGTLSQLNALFLGGNQLTTLPENFANLSQLTHLFLGRNRLTTLSESISALSHLILLELDNNQLTTLPESITKLSQLSNLSVVENPLETPPIDIADQGIDAVRNYFKQRNEQGSERLYEAKVLIVGQPGAGKSSLMKKLCNPDYPVPNPDEDSTVGITVESSWRFPVKNDIETEFQVHLWDFGGQEIQYMTHQFFLTSRSLYILVADDRKQDTEFDYWFKIIELMGKNCPVIVLLNQHNHKSVTNFDEQRYLKLFPTMKFIRKEFDLTDDVAALADMRATVQRELLNLEHIGDELPANWIPIRQELENNTEKKHINFADYTVVCAKHGIDKEEDQLYLSRYLHDLGVILHYQDDAALFDFIILDPQWAVDAVYVLLSNTLVKDQQGRFSQHQLFEMWSDKYSKQECYKLLSLMRRDHFEICYQLNDTNEAQFVAPSLLPGERPGYDWDKNANLQFQYNYPFMPKGIMARLMVRLHDIIEKVENSELIWQRGMVLKSGEVKAELIQDEDLNTGAQTINIRIQGNDYYKRELLSRIRNEVEAIHKRSFKGLRVEEFIQCTCTKCKTDPNPRFYPFTDLENYVEFKRPSIFCTNSGEDISIRALLEGIIEPGMDTRSMTFDKHQQIAKLADIEGDKYTQIYLQTSPITISADTSLSNMTSVENTTTVTVTINQTINGFQAALGNLREDLLEELDDETVDKKQLSREFDKAEKAIAEIGEPSSPDEINNDPIKLGAMQRLKNFVDKLDKADKNLGKGIKMIEDGVDHAKSLAGHYNKLAQWCGLPVVPDAFTK